MVPVYMGNMARFFTFYTVLNDVSHLNVYDTELGRMSGLVCWEHTMDLVCHSLIAV
jgi:hypothetical protein